MGNIQFCNYKLLLYGKAWRRLSSDQNDIWTGVFLICLDFLLEKPDFQTRFPSKPHWRDLLLLCEPKIKLPNKNGTKFPSLVPTGALNWNTSEYFLLPKNSTRHTATSSDVNVEKRDSENFQLFNHLLLREDGEIWWSSPKRPLVWELEALFGIPTKINHSLGIWGMSHFEFHIYILTSIVLTNSRLPSPCQRYLYMKKLLKTKRAPSRWCQDGLDIPIDGMYSNKWQYCLHMRRSYKVFLRKRESNCMERLSAWSFSKSTKSSGRCPTCEKNRPWIGYSTMVVPYT